MTAASTFTFAVVFGAFVVASLVLIVLTLRFVLGRAAAARADWLGRSDDESAAGSETDEDAEADEGEPEVTALVLGGGGTRGAVQIGMLQVLVEHGFVPDRVYGSSVGAVNGVAFAGDPTPEGVARMTQIWQGLRRDSIYPQGRLHGPWRYLQQRDSVYANTGLRAVVEEGFPFELLEDAVIPVEVAATSLTDGRERWFTRGSAVEAVLASTAMPAIYPPVEIDGERFIDGGVVDNVPIQRAIDAGATRIVVLLCAPPTFTPAVPKRPAEAIVNALLIAIHSRFARDMAQLPDGIEVILCVGPEVATRDFDDFSTTELLIAQGREEASEVVRRYGLGTIPYPRSPAPVPAVGPEKSPPNGRAPDNGTGDGAGLGTSGAQNAGDPSVSGSSPAGGATVPLTHPEPRT